MVEHHDVRHAVEPVHDERSSVVHPTRAKQGSKWQPDGDTRSARRDVDNVNRIMISRFPNWSADRPPIGTELGQSDTAPRESFSQTTARRATSISRRPVAPLVVTINSRPSRSTIQSPRKKPSMTFSARPPAVGMRHVSRLFSWSDVNTIDCPSGDQTGHESAASSLVIWRRSDPSTRCVQMSEFPVVVAANATREPSGDSEECEMTSFGKAVT